MDTNTKGYCIGKATRYRAGQKVTQHPFYNLTIKNDYDRLRSETYSTVEYAQEAAQAAAAYNPVGFVVIELVDAS